MMSINLFCLPYAGGSSYSYKNFEQYAGKHIRIVPVELPGRGRRMREKLQANILDLTNDLFRQIEDDLAGPYAIYGHSMGSLLGYLLTVKIILEGRNQPRHLFFSGAAAPSTIKLEPRHNLPRGMFFEKVRELGGLPDYVLQDEVLLNFCEPILRADFQAVENYTYESTPPFDVPISLFLGTEEKITATEVMNWNNETTRGIELKKFPGDHFFIFHHQPEIMNIINNKLLNN